ncbi:MAG: hypothetical protein N3B16_05200 [Candidatus Aminicenantes bacterium]|nr:hypothetical protein [Candidatus Aminicenantes bacterium]
MGLVTIIPADQKKIPEKTKPAFSLFNDYSPKKEFASISLNNGLFRVGQNYFELKAAGKDAVAEGMEIAIFGLSLSPSVRKFIRELKIFGPFDVTDFISRQKFYPQKARLILRKHV